jgi:two-component system cell cycle sensor histidine kinase/response regulator CckA
MSEAFRLFLIEDDDAIALLIRKSLERAGHQVTRCRTAADALIVLGHGAYDLVLLDYILPDMTGVDLLQMLAREGIGTPALMVTGHGDEQLAARVLRAGALDYVVKDPALTFLADLPKRIAESVTRYRLQHMNLLLIQALESARDGVMITDLHGSILHVNQALEEMTGYSRTELLGQNPRLLKSGVHAPEVYTALWRTVLNRASWQGELTNRRKDGTFSEVSLTVSPIVDQYGQMTHFIGIQRDVADRKRLERQLMQAQKMQSVGTLAGGVAHEFNNLLAGINGYASLGLRESGVPGTVLEFLQHIVELSERAATLTRQLLTFARKPALLRQPLRMDELVRSTAELVNRTLRVDVQLDLQETASDGGPLLVEADSNQLQQAMVNLALNARDAVATRLNSKAEPVKASSGASGSVGMRPASIPLLIRLRQATPTTETPAFPQNIPPGDYVLVEVVDQGCGMTSEVLSQAIDPFFTTKDVGQGTGLGLPMVFGIVQGHQGFMAIESEPTKGTTVGLYMQRLVQPSAKVETSEFESGQVLEPETAPGRNILVIDDEEAVLDVVRRFLEIAGHKVTCASSGHAGLELLSAAVNVDLVILDLMMPREDAVTTFQRLKQRRPSMPILLCTGMPLGQPTPQLLAAGAMGVLRKPFRMNELWYAVNQALSGKTLAN